MRLIPKMQAGGLTYVPRETPLQLSSWYWFSKGNLQLLAATAAQAGQSAGGKEGNSLLSEDMIKTLYKSGLPNDVDAFLSSVNAFGDGLSGSGASSAGQYKQIISGLNKITYNKEVFDLALKEALRKGIMQLPAIDSSGRVFVKLADGSLTKKTVAKLNDRDMGRIVSYGELAKIRANDPSAAFDGGMLAEVIAGGVSLLEVFKSILDIAVNIGTDKVSRDDVKLKSSSARQIVEGVQDVMSEPDGVYKINEKSSTLRKKAEIGMRYILETLTPLQSAAIALQAKMTGTNPLQIVADGVNYRLDDEYSYSVNWQKYNDGTGTGSGSGAGTGKGKTYEMNQIMQIVTGDGLLHQTIQITPGRGLAYQVDGQIISWIPKADGNGTVGPSSGAEAILTSQLGRVLNTNAIHVGNQLIDATLLSRMYYDGSQFYAVELPVTYDKNGQPMPNWGLLDNYEKALKEINRRGGMNNLSPQVINQIFKVNGLNQYINEDGSLNRKNFMRFVGISLIGDESVFKDADETPGVFTKIDDDNLQNTMALTLTKDKKNPYKIDGDVYRAIAYIPIYDSFMNARAASGQDPWVQDPGYAQLYADELMMYRLKELPQMKNNLSKSAL